MQPTEEFGILVFGLNFPKHCAAFISHLALLEL
jgi:hypothetical protein